MKNGIKEKFRIELESNLKKESLLEQKVNNLDLSFSGLRDLDDLFCLITTKLEIALACISALESNHHSNETIQLQEIAKTRSRAAVQLLENLLDLPISEDQKHLVEDAPGYKKAKDLLHKFLLKGGGFFFQTNISEKKKAKKIADVIIGSIEKYAGRDEEYEPFIKPEKLPGFIRKIITFFLPVLVPENQKGPPYGINEGEEVLYTSKRMRMPLSQAIFYLENELLPQMKRELEKSPGDARLQKKIYETEKSIKVFKQLKFIPRSSPVFPEKGYFTHGLSGYTDDGELLVTLHIPVTIKSGTNIERMLQMVKSDVTRKLAGKGICPELDQQYFYLKRIESGRRGNSRTPSFKLDTSIGFSLLKNMYPFLQQLEHRDVFQKLIRLVLTSGTKNARKLITQMIIHGDYEFKALP
jgi:hypothetical protein